MCRTKSQNLYQIFNSNRSSQRALTRTRMRKSIDSCHLLLLLLLCFLVLPPKGSSSSLFHRNKDTEETVASIKQEQDHSHEVHCSRERSRAAWKVIEEYLMPFVEQENYQITRKCLLHADNDMFRDQEQHKVHVDINDWQCGYCKKSFRAEKFLDQHFDNRHYNLLNVSQSKCLANLCGALHCDLVMGSKMHKTKCSLAAASRNRHLCESLANTCFPGNGGPSSSRLHELFLRQFCDAHTCTGGKKPFPRGGKKRTSVFYLAISILTLMLVPLFYCIVYLQQMEKRKGVQDLKRISNRNKSKPS